MYHCGTESSDWIPRVRKFCASKRQVKSADCIKQLLFFRSSVDTGFLEHTRARLARLHLHGCAVPPLGGTGPFLQLSLTFRFMLELRMDQGQSLRFMKICRPLWVIECVWESEHVCIASAIGYFRLPTFEVVITSSSHSSALLTERTGTMEKTRFILVYLLGKSY